MSSGVAVTLMPGMGAKRLCCLSIPSDVSALADNNTTDSRANRLAPPDLTMHMNTRGMTEPLAECTGEISVIGIPTGEGYGAQRLARLRPQALNDARSLIQVH
jgi:hypothetical protein